MKRFTITMIMGLVYALGLGACVAPPPPRAPVQTATPVVTPTIPPIPIELTDLPKTGWLLISNLDSGMRAVVWEHIGMPGTDPSYPNSDRGKELGSVNEGDELEILDFAWSEADQNYQVLIKKDSLKGWIDFNIVTFEKPQ